MKKRKKEHEKEPNHERWLVSYADFITLLFAVFVTLYAMGQVDKKKTEQVIQSLHQAFGMTVVPPPDAKYFIQAGAFQTIPILNSDGMVADRRKVRLRDEIGDLLLIKGILDKEISAANSQSTRIELNQRGLVVSLQVGDLFDPGRAELRPQSYALLDRIAQVLGKFGNPLSIEGFTDNSPLHSEQFASNWELSSARALSVLHFLIDQYHFDPALLSATGFGPNHPIADNSTPEGRQVNRRVEIVVLDKVDPNPKPW